MAVLNKEQGKALQKSLNNLAKSDQPKDKQPTNCTCPECGRKLIYLTNIISGVQKYDLSINKDGLENYVMMDFESDGDVNEFWCPECGATLFYEEREAVKFLRGE